MRVLLTNGGFVACRRSLPVDAVGVDMGRVSVRIRMGNERGVAEMARRGNDTVSPMQGITNRREVGA